jgi:hypothetical protein
LRTLTNKTRTELKHGVKVLSYLDRKYGAQPRKQGPRLPNNQLPHFKQKNRRIWADPYIDGLFGAYRPARRARA